MAERPPFPEKETEICKLSCESMAEMRATPPPPPIKSTDIPARPSIIMSPATPSFMSNCYPLQPPFISSQLISDHHLQGNPSSILIPNPNPNSIGSRNPTINASPSFRSTPAVTNPLNYYANHNNEKISSCRFKKAEPAKCSSSIDSSGLADRRPIPPAEPITEPHLLQGKVDDVGLPGSHDQSMIGQVGFLAAHAYSPWIVSWADDQYQEAPEAGLMARDRSICEEYTAADNSGRASVLRDDRDRPLILERACIDSPFNAYSAPPSPPSRIDGPTAGPSSTSSSASELQNTSAVDDSTSNLPAPAAQPLHETVDQGVDASQDAVSTDVNKPPLKKQRRKGQKRVRAARVALLTKSEVEHLEDGYRWRKYGQKAVKNSPHPRSYYRCTNSKCSVKKRVERCSEDPSLVVTTYEGQHTHHSPAFLRGSILPDPNYPLPSTGNVPLVPWQSPLLNANYPHFPSNFAHNPLVRSTFPSASMVLSSFPQMSTPLSFPPIHPLPIPTLGDAHAEKAMPEQPQVEASHGLVINSRHSFFMQAFEASDRDRQQLSSFVHVPPVAPARVQAPLIDKGLLHDMLPHPCLRSASPPTSST